MKLVIIARNQKGQSPAAVLADNEDLARAFFQGAGIDYDHLDITSPDESDPPAIICIFKTEIRYMGFEGNYDDYAVVTS